MMGIVDGGITMKLCSGGKRPALHRNNGRFIHINHPSKLASHYSFRCTMIIVATE
jgi:hypothetical protein